MKWTDHVSAAADIATATTLLVAVLAAWTAWRSARTTAVQNEEYAGAESAVAWRQQVLDLHDRGLSPAQIRFVFHLEDGGDGYEAWVGRIDDIVGTLPVRRSPRRVRAGRRVVAGGGRTVAGDGRTSGAAGGSPGCPRMPARRGGCTGDCRTVLVTNGSLAFRETDDRLTT